MQQNINTFDLHMKTIYGQKMYKLSLNAGLSCPNRDGTLGTKGCIFCSAGGSGEFASSSDLSIEDQINQAKQLIANKLPLKYSTAQPRYIAYFQAYTNTYAPLSFLKELFLKTLQHPEIAAISIATRPDCLADDVISMLSELNQVKPVWIELGLQTIHQTTADYIRRGYPLSIFEHAVSKLRANNITVIVHVILGLPYEKPSHMFETITYLSHQPIQGIKLQLLHILKNTDLAEIFLAQSPQEQNQTFALLDLSNYLDTLIHCIELLPSNIVLHRITGDGDKRSLLAPLWSGNKRNVLNTFQQEIRNRGTIQGSQYK